MEELVYLTFVAMKTGKKQFLSYHSNSCCDKNKLNEKHESYRFKLPLKKLAWLDHIKFYNLKNVHFKKNCAKVKTITTLHFMTTFHNFAPRIETGWPARVVKLN